MKSEHVAVLIACFCLGAIAGLLTTAVVVEGTFRTTLEVHGKPVVYGLTEEEYMQLDDYAQELIRMR